MRVLITSHYNSRNTYVKEICDGISEHCEIVTQPQNFWVSNLHFDIVHIQWPEELFYWKQITEADLSALKTRLAHFKNHGSKLIATLHNRTPHRKQKLDEQLYEVVYKSADAIVHLGQYSTELYPNQKNVIIFHPNYSRQFEVKEKKPNSNTVFLSFGAIRHREEEENLIRAFEKMNAKNAQLFIANSLVGINPFQTCKKDYFKMLSYNLYLKKLRNKGLFLIPRKLSHEDLQIYLNRADVVVSPRLDALNSGVVVMGFTFGKTVVGPAIGNIKELLEVNHNPAFIPGDVDSMAECLRRASGNLEIGRLNQKYSNQYLDPKRIARQHQQLYNSLMGDK